MGGKQGQMMKALRATVVSTLRTRGAVEGSTLGKGMGTYVPESIVSDCVKKGPGGEQDRKQGQERRGCPVVQERDDSLE